MVRKRNGEDGSLGVCSTDGSRVLLRMLTFEWPRAEGVSQSSERLITWGLQTASAEEGLCQRGESLRALALGSSPCHLHTDAVTHLLGNFVSAACPL